MKIFKEEQRFNQTWLIGLIVISSMIPLILIIKEYSDGKLTFNSLLITLAVIITSSCLIFFFKLKTRIDEKGIHYQFLPIHFKQKTIFWNQISSISIRKYDAITEYGGWGLKGGFLWNKAKGKAINVSGNIGIQLELKNGKKLLIGTQKESEAKQVLANYKKN